MMFKIIFMSAFMFFGVQAFGSEKMGVSCEDISEKIKDADLQSTFCDMKGYLKLGESQPAPKKPVNGIKRFGIIRKYTVDNKLLDLKNLADAWGELSQDHNANEAQKEYAQAKASHYKVKYEEFEKEVDEYNSLSASEGKK